MTANSKKTSRRIFRYDFGCKKKALSDFLASSSSWKTANTGKPPENINKLILISFYRFTWLIVFRDTLLSRLKRSLAVWNAIKYFMIKLYNRHWQLKYDATIILTIVLLTNCSADKKTPNKRQRFVDGPWYLPCFLQPLSVERYGYITLLVYKIRKITLFFPQEISVHITENYHTLMQRKNISNCSLHSPFSHRPPFIVSVHVSPNYIYFIDC